MADFKPLGDPALFLYCAMAQRHGMSMRAALDLYRQNEGRVRTAYFAKLWRLSAESRNVFGLSGALSRVA